MPDVSPCRTPFELQALLNGGLPEAERAALAAHVQACERCRAAVAALPAAGPGTVAHSSGIEQTRIAPPPTPGDSASFPMTLPAPTEPELKRLAHYQIVKQLGAGGMGVVYLAEDSKLERRVALKVMRPEFAAVGLHKERFLREARATAKIQNDHIVTIYQVDEENGVIFLAMQLLQGESMESWLQRGQRPAIKQAVRLGREIAQGLAAAHARGLIHRDIKPANLWLEAPKGRVKILDFGLARTGGGGDQHLTSSGMIVGTPAYMAPEQARAESLDGRADLYSLGVVLYRLCTGRLPFDGKDAMSLLIAAALETPPSVSELNPDAPPELDAFIAQLMAKDPAGRPASAKAAVEQLAAIESALRRGKPSSSPETVDVVLAMLVPSPALEPTMVEPIEPIEPAISVRRKRRKPPPRSKLPAVLTALGAALVLLLAGYVIWVKTDRGTLEVSAADDDLEVTVEQNGKLVQVVDGKSGQALQLRTGTYSLKPASKTGARGELELTTNQDTNEITLSRGGKVVATVRRRPLPDKPKVVPPEIPPTPPPPLDTDATPDKPELPSNVPVRTIAWHEPDGDAHLLMYTADGKSLLVGRKNWLKRFDAETLLERESTPLGKPYDGLWRCAAKADGSLLALRTNSQKLVLYDASMHKALVELPMQTDAALALSPDGSLLAGDFGKEASVWNVAAGRPLGGLVNHPDVVRVVAFAPDGKSLAVGCLNGSVWLWNLANGQHVDVTPKPLQEIIGLAYSPNGQRLAIGRRHSTRLLEIAGLKETPGWRPAGGVVAFSPDGRYVACVRPDHRIKMYDFIANAHTILPAEHTSAVTQLAFSQDSRHLASAGKDATVKVWNLGPLLGSANYVPLFNRRDLTGWKPSVGTTAFAVEGDSLVSTGKAKAWLLTDEDYGDFELRLEYKLEKAANIRIGLRVEAQPRVMPAMRIQLVDDAHFMAAAGATSFKPESRTGAILGLKAPSVLNNNKIGEWNTLHVLIEGKHVIVDVNELRVVDYVIDKEQLAKRPQTGRVSGRIALQSWEGRVEFRSLYVKRLKPEKK